MEEPVDISLLDRFIRMETIPEEELRLLEWFRAEGSRKEIFAYYRQRWEEAANTTMPREQQQGIFHRLKARIRETKPIRKQRTTFINRWVQYAAIALLCLGLGAGITFFMQKFIMDEQTKEFVVKADKGQRASISLPDGTNVWLNSHTELIYTNHYGTKGRTVSLTGEAYFEVAPDAENRFIVKAGEMEIEALGTSFNIKAYREDRDITTTLFTGRVRAATATEEVILDPDQYASFNRSRQELTTGVTDSFYARMWRENELAFESHTLEEIAVMLDRMYNVHIEFSSDKIKQYRFSGVIKNNSLDNVFEILSLTVPITYQSTEDTIRISEKPTR